jgi:DNA topoisomerase-1
MKKKGLSRKKIGNESPEKGSHDWIYFDESGKEVLDQKIIERCNKLTLPPAWIDVWISLDPDCKLQATGIDSKGRTQYRYHDNWTKVRSSEKFQGMIAFAHALPTIRKKINLDMNLSGMPKNKVIASVIQLMDKYHIRVGNDVYAKNNKSYGLTTLKEGHITIDRSNTAEGKLDAVFEFTGKSGKAWHRRIVEDDLALLIEASGKVGGKSHAQDLFRFEDQKGQNFDIKSAYVNEYLDTISSTQKKITAKDFRTWAATWKTAFHLSQNFDEDHTKAKRKKILSEVLKTVSADLGNTPTVCKNSYVHPIIISDWESGEFREKWNNACLSRKKYGLSREETITLRYIKIGNN